MRHVHRDRHQLFVLGDIKNFFPIRTPACLCAALVGYLDSPAWAAERCHIYLLITARTRAGESDPFPIWRKLGFSTRSVACLRMVTEVKKLQLGPTVLKIHVNEKTPIRRPVIGNQKIGRRESLRFAGTIGSRNVDVLRSPGIIDHVGHPFAVRRENRKYFCPPSETRVLVPLEKS
jgi:hypothetical protein